MPHIFETGVVQNQRLMNVNAQLLNQVVHCTLRQGEWSQDYVLEQPASYNLPIEMRFGVPQLAPVDFRNSHSIFGNPQSVEGNNLNLLSLTLENQYCWGDCAPYTPSLELKPSFGSETNIQTTLNSSNVTNFDERSSISSNSETSYSPGTNLDFR